MVRRTHEAKARKQRASVVVWREGELNTLVSIGPGAEVVPKKPLANPVCIRVLGGLNNYNPGTDEEIDPPEPVYRIDVLIPSIESKSGYEQRNIALTCERKVPPSGARIGEHLWLFEPGGNTAMRSLSMLVDRQELVAKLRALADNIEMIV